ncbi:MAG: hypothetical protein ABI782_09370 [Anaerolineaceae bacterium]
MPEVLSQFDELRDETGHDRTVCVGHVPERSVHTAGYAPAEAP